MASGQWVPYLLVECVEEIELLRKELDLVDEDRCNLHCELAANDEKDQVVKS